MWKNKHASMAIAIQSATDIVLRYHPGNKQKLTSWILIVVIISYNWISNSAPVCGVDEVYNGCLESVCEATTCKQLGYPFGCTAAVPTTCTEGCLCKEGYLRADNATCIPAKACRK